MKVSIKIPMYKAKVTVLVGEYSDVEKDIPYFTDCFSEAGYLARTAFRRVPGEKYPHQVIIHSKSKSIGVIAHEAVHAASFIYDEIGAVSSFENDEHVAYMVEHICVKVEKALNR